MVPLLDSDSSHSDACLRSNVVVSEVSQGLPLHRNQDQVVLFFANRGEGQFIIINSAIGTPFAASNRQRRNGTILGVLLEGFQLLVRSEGRYMQKKQEVNTNEFKQWTNDAYNHVAYNKRRPSIHKAFISRSTCPCLNMIRFLLWTVSDILDMRQLWIPPPKAPCVQDILKIKEKHYLDALNVKDLRRTFSEAKTKNTANGTRVVMIKELC